MRSFLALLLAGLPALAQDIIAKTDPKTPADEWKSFKVPAGFEVQLVAAEPDIEKPIQIAWDSAGRLWVTTTRHYPFPAEPGKASDKLMILSDFDPSGKAKKIETFYAGLNIPIGVLPLPDGKSCLVSEVGRILKLTDTKGAGKADLVEELFTGFGTEDTHGMTNSFLYMPDGWVYATHGFKNTSKVKAKDGSQIEMNSGNTYRFKPDGSRIEIVTRGQVNPFGLCCDPYLNLYTADCHSKPITQLIRGAVYQSFGKPHDGLGFAPHVTNHSHGSTALCGLEWYSDTKFPKEYQNCMFLGNVVTNRINADRMTFKGSTPVAEELPDFLTSSDPWFRPTDIKLGMDGALYFADFYNRIIGHYEVKLDHPQRDKDRGRVWRIVSKGDPSSRVASAPGVIDLKKAKLEDLYELLAVSNLTTKHLAFHEIVRRFQFDSKLDVGMPGNFAGNLTPFDTSRYLGYLANAGERVGRLEDLAGGEYAAMIEAALKHIPAEDRRTLAGSAMRAFASKAKWEDADRKLAIKTFEDFPDTPWIHRAVVDGIVLNPHADFVPTLLKFMPTIPAEDTHLKFAARVALRDCLELDEHRGGWAGLDDARTAVLVDAGLGCKSSSVLEGLVALNAKNLVAADRLSDLYSRVGRYGDNELKAALLVARDMQHARYAKHALNMAKGMQAAGWKPTEKNANTVIDPLIELVSVTLKFPQSDGEGISIKDGVSGARNLFIETRKLCDPKTVAANYGVFLEGLRSIAVSKAYDIEQRLGALEVLLISNFDGSRAEMQPLIASVALDNESRERLLLLLLQNKPTVSECTLAKDAIKTAKYATAIQLATGLAGDAFGADLLLAAVKAGDAPARLLQEKAVLDRLKATKVNNLDAKVKELTAGIPSAEKRIDDLIKKRAAAFPKAKADAAKGKAVFAKNCAACHTLENVGAKVGPQLDGIGVRGLDRLLEDTLDPNRNIDAAFRATKFDTLDGKTIVGLLLREEGAVYVVSDPQGKEIRLPKADVDKKTVIQQSAMPSNVDTLVPEKDYYDLLAYLLAQKPK